MRNIPVLACFLCVTSLKHTRQVYTGRMNAALCRV